MTDAGSGPHDGLKPFQRLQSAFAAHLRDPENVPPPPDIEPRRMAIYARLVYNNVESVLGSVYRGVREIIGKDAWRALVRDFLRSHAAESPFYSKLPDEFLDYLADRPDDRPAVPPFTLELCHYAWVQYTLGLAPDMPSQAFDDEPVASADVLALSSLALPLRYAYPVTEIGPDCQPTAPPEAPTYLIACRNRHDEVRMLASNAATIRLLELIDEGLRTGEAFGRLAVEVDRPREVVERSGLAILNRLHEQDVVVRKSTRAAVPKMDEK